MVEIIIFLKTTYICVEILLYMLVAICRPPLYRPDVKVYKLSPLKRPWQENQMCENAADQQFRCYILKY